MKKIFLTTTLVFLSLPAFSASFSLSGQYRFGSNMLINTDLMDGSREGAENSTTFLEHRFLLRPDVLIDERFTIKSELNFSQALAGNTVPSHFGSTLDSNNSPAAGDQAFLLSSLYLNWASDWGLFRFGRIPKSWGLGLLYDAGDSPFSDFKTIKDRADFQAMLGNLGLRIAFEKGAEGRVSRDWDDVDTYELAIDFANAEASSNVGILYSRNVRSPGAKVGRKSSHDLSIFAKQKWNKFQLGGEFVTISEEDRNASTGLLLQVDTKRAPWSFGYDFAFASASNNSSFVFNPNYRPFMFLFRHNLGPQAPVESIRNVQGVGSDVVGDGSSGAMLHKLHASYSFDSSQLVLGVDMGFASLGRAGANGEKSLGFETDLFLSQRWYDNFRVQYALGFLKPGEAFGSSPKSAWGVEIKGALEF